MDSSTNIVLGPPGTGKTTYLLNQVERVLAEGAPPERVGYVSFTRKAAHEAADRAGKKFNLPRSRLPWFRTIHSLCFAALGLTSSDVLEGERLKEFGDWIGMPVSARMSMDEGATLGFQMGDRCLFMENLSRVREITVRQQYEEDSDGLYWFQVEKFARGLAEYKEKQHLYDYTDMLRMFVDSDWNARLEYLFVDESQDLSLLQWRVVEKLAKGAREVYVAGDDDQAIYRWAGAAVEHFAAMPGRVHTLSQSWRVPEAIRSVAMDVVDRIAYRRPKDWQPRVGTPGAVARVGRVEDAPIDTGEETLFLSRNTCFLRDEVIPVLDHGGFFYEFRGGQSVAPAVVGAVLDWERLRAGEAVGVTEIRRIYALMQAGVGFSRGYKKLPQFKDDEMMTMAELRERGGLIANDAPWYDVMTAIPGKEKADMRRALSLGQKLTRRPSVRLSTIHGSKGGEADHVVLLTDLAHRTSAEAEKWPDDEARCWYVAATRAKKRLTIVAPQTRRGYRI